jgi:hypothetical protein
MLTTAGSTSFAMVEKVLESTTGLGTFKGVASELPDCCCSLPFTPCAITDPIRMPAVSVAKIVKVESKRPRCDRPNQEFIGGSPLFKSVSAAQEAQGPQPFSI